MRNEDEIVRKQRTGNATKSIENAGEAALHEIEKIIDTSSFIVKQQALDELVKLKATYGWRVMHFDKAMESIEKEKRQLIAALKI